MMKIPKQQYTLEFKLLAVTASLLGSLMSWWLKNWGCRVKLCAIGLRPLMKANFLGQDLKP